MKGYHISIGIGEKNKCFEPRIPTQKLHDENDSINRVCASTTLNGCILAHPDSCYLRGGYKGFISIYELNLDSYKYLNNEELIKNKYVPDARYTGEVWILDKCYAKRSLAYIDTESNRVGRKDLNNDMPVLETEVENFNRYYSIKIQENNLELIVRLFENAGYKDIEYHYIYDELSRNNIKQIDPLKLSVKAKEITQYRLTLTVPKGVNSSLIWEMIGLGEELFMKYLEEMKKGMIQKCL